MERSPVVRRQAAATLTGRTEEDDAGAQAIRALAKAEYPAKRPAWDQFDAMAKDREAQVVRENGERLRRANGSHLLKTAGEMLQYEPGPIKGVSQEQLALEVAMIDTLETPDMIGLGASQLRMEAATKVGILQPALDAVETAQAANSIEKMLCHQLTACHFAAMALYARATGAQEIGRPDAADTVRFMNAAARQADTFREGALALLKLKTGGKQTVVVQHVHVSDGGQAVIAGNVSKGGPGATTGEGSEK